LPTRSKSTGNSRKQLIYWLHGTDYSALRGVAERGLFNVGGSMDGDKQWSLGDGSHSAPAINRSGELDKHGRLEARALARRRIGEPEQARLFDDGSAHLTLPVRLKGIRVERLHAAAQSASLAAGKSNC
jgi:hypothetical protein